MKPTEKFIFDPYPNKIEELIEDLEPYLDDIAAKKTLDRLLDYVYKSGFNDGIAFMKWMEE